MKRRSFLQYLAVAFSSLLVPFRLMLPREAVGKGKAKPLSTIAFGSCLEQNDAMPIWRAVKKSGAGLFVFLGDNVYADTEDMALMKKCYETLGANPDFARFREKVPVIATWDDHDYGANDSGAEYPKKKEAKQIFLDFFREPKGSARRQREGIYTSYIYGPKHYRVQVILLDLRTFRGPIVGDTGEYRPNPDPKASLLGAAQWAWLEEQLQEPAELRILASSVQLVASGHGWEKWANFPREKARFYALLDELEVENLLAISGDMHFAELSMEKTPGGIPIYDLTASGMNRKESQPEMANANRNRLFFKDDFHHFGLLRVEWGERRRDDVLVSLEIRDEAGAKTFSKWVGFPRYDD